MKTVGAYRWEVRKLAAQKRTYAGLIAAAIYALAFVIVLTVKKHNTLPSDVPLGSQIRRSGLALPPVPLGFASIFGAPLVTALVAGDIVANEDANRTLKTIFMRSTGRGSIYAGKALAAASYVDAILAVTGGVALVGALLSWGLHPVHSTTGATLAAGHALGLVFAAYGVYLLPVLVIASFAFFLSTVTRNSAGALVGALLSRRCRESARSSTTCCRRSSTRGSHCSAAATPTSGSAGRRGRARCTEGSRCSRAGSISGGATSPAAESASRRAAGIARGRAGPSRANTSRRSTRTPRANGPSARRRRRR
jgi:ABC-2 family transporter protein